MVNFKAKTAKENKREKGIALIFTLIMLSLLLILALSFALDSMFEQKAAYNSANASAANLAAKTELNQLLSFLEYGSPNFSNSTVYSIGSYTDKEGTNHYDQDMLVNGTDYPSLLLTDGLITSSNINSLCFGAAANNQITWTYHNDDTGKIIGRTAFVVIPQEKISLPSLVDERIGTTEYPRHNEINDTETRIGKYVSEINVRRFLPNVASSVLDKVAEALNYATDKPELGAGFTNGQYTGTWSSYDSLFSTLATAIGRSLTQTEKDDFENNLDIDNTKDSEAFWVNLDGNTEINSDAGADVNNPVSTYELYKRFDLTRNWNTADNATDIAFIKDKILLTSSGSAPDIDMEKWTPSDSDGSSKGLPWLATFGYQTDGTEDQSLKGTFANVKDRRYQIAANLKDYCDSGDDNRPTSDVDPDTWFTLDPATDTPPTYTGNERTPYINKVGLKILAKQKNTGTGPYYLRVDFQVFPAVELVNIYGATYPDTLGVSMKFEVTFKTTVVGGTGSYEYTKEFDSTLSVSKWLNGHSHFVLSSGYFTGSTNYDETTNASKKISCEVVSIKFKRVALVNGSAGYDYVKNLNQSPTPVSLTLNAGESEKCLWYGFAVHDPRQNLNGTDGTSPDWKSLSATTEGTDPTLIFPLYDDGSDNYGLANSSSPSLTDSPSMGSDPEPGIADPAAETLSTAYIRNAPMESPWELGFIHRGEKWQTLNLKKYVSAKAYSAISIGSPAKYYLQGGGIYSDGDANILDQIKMTSKAESPAKINFRTTDNKILNYLFSKVNLGSTIVRDNTNSPVDPSVHMTVNSMATGGSTIIDPDDTGTSYYSDYTQMISDINGINALTRAAYADKIKTFAATLGNTDAKQEELIGKTINLTKVNLTPGDGNYYIVIVSQTIKDVGGNGSDIKIYKTPADGSAAQEVNCRLGRFDVTGSSANWKNNAYGDDITATQKILIKTSKVNNKIKVTEFKYID